MEGENNNAVPTGNGGGAGPIIGIIVILAIVVLGGLYFWKERSTMPEGAEEIENVEEVAPAPEATSTNEMELELETEINAS